MKKRIRFIINPLSGGRNKSTLPAAIKKNLDHVAIDAEIVVSENAQQTTDLAREAVSRKFDAVVACGGDGTINNIAPFLVNTTVALGIIPLGSGNGFSRELKIPFKVSEAIETINQFFFKTADTAEINGLPFVNIIGVGFDAHIAGLFEGSVKRGLKTYTKMIIKEFGAYKPENYKLIIEGQTIETRAFLIAVNNGAQFGNNARISPLADMQDGLLNVTIIKECRWVDVPFMAIRLFNGTLHKHAQTETYTARSLEILRSGEKVVNVDGEPVNLNHHLRIKVLPGSLKVIVPFG